MIKSPGSTVSGENIYRFNELLRKTLPQPPVVDIDADKDLAYIMYTGGTTGFPKGVPGSHASEVSYVSDVMDLFRGYIDEGKDTMIMVNPLFHIMAKGFLLAAGLNFGITTVLMPVPEVDPETLEEVEVGVTGELLVTSVYTIKNYWNKPEETKASYVKIGEEIFYRMGDYVCINENGEIQFVERTADTIKYKAYRISASEIEAVLQDHPTVMGACAVGIPDASCGERIKAIVVLKEDAKGVDGQTLTNWCRKRMAPYKIPHYIGFRDMLPKSKVGKLLRREIRDEEKRKEAQ